MQLMGPIDFAAKFLLDSPKKFTSNQYTEEKKHVVTLVSGRQHVRTNIFFLNRKTRYLPIQIFTREMNFIFKYVNFILLLHKTFLTSSEGSNDFAVTIFCHFS